MDQKSPKPSSSKRQCKNNGGDQGQTKVLTGDKAEDSSKNPLQNNKKAMNIVLSFCDVPTLKAARLVCKFWNSEIIPKLYQKAYFTVPSNFYNKSQKDQKSAIVQMKKFLSAYQVRLSNIQVASLQQIPTFNDFGKPGSNPCIGPHVKKIRLGCGVYESMKDLKDLFHRMKNLKVLDTRPWIMQDEILEPGNIYPNLIKLCAKLYPRELTLVDFRMLFGMSEYEGLEYLNKMKYFSTMSNVRIQEFGFSVFPCSRIIPDIRPQMSQTLSNILNINKDNMKCLTASGCEMYLGKSKVPIMPCLEYFFWTVRPPCRCHVFQNHPNYSFPPGFQFSLNFPNMHQMDIMYTLNCAEEIEIDPEFWESFFANQNPTPSLKILTYNDQACDFNLDPILRCFTELELFILSNPGDLSVATKSIFTYGSNLRALKFVINLEDLTSTTASFDAIFMGFSQKTVNKVKSSANDEDVKEILGVEKTLDALRIQPSLLDLPGLKLLSITICGDIEEQEDSEKELASKMLYATAKCAVHLLPLLSINIHIEGCGDTKGVKLALKEVAELPNVTVFCKEDEDSVDDSKKEEKEEEGETEVC